MYISLTLLLLTVTIVTQGYQHFRYHIPNGEFVIHPCFDVNVLWYGVGHKNPLGGGEMNQFGLDFASQGYVSCCALIMTVYSKMVGCVVTMDMPFGQF